MARAPSPQDGANYPAPSPDDALRAMARARLAEALRVLDEQLGPNLDLARAIKQAGDDAARSAFLSLTEDVMVLALAALGVSLYPAGSA